MEQFAVVKSGSPAKIIGPFYNFEAAGQHIILNKLVGFTILPMTNPERTLSEAVNQYITETLANQPELRDRKIILIKMVREKFGFGLKEAKDFVDIEIPPPVIPPRPGSTSPWQT